MITQMLWSQLNSYIDDSFEFQVSTNSMITITVDQTDVQFIANNSISSVFETGRTLNSAFNPTGASSYTIGLIEVYMSAKYYKIVEEKIYEPVFRRDLNNPSSLLANNSQSSTTDSLNSKETEINDRNEYYFLFVMAQIGGLYSFLSFVFKIVFRFIIQKFYYMDLINILRYKLKYKRMKCGYNDPNSALSKVLPLEEEANYEYKKLPYIDRSSDNLKENAITVHHKTINNKQSSLFSSINDKDIGLNSSDFINKNITYNLKDLFYAVVCIWKSRKVKMTPSEPKISRYQQYLSDRKKLNIEMDLSNILWSINELKFSIEKLKLEKVNRHDGDSIESIHIKVK